MSRGQFRLLYYCAHNETVSAVEADLRSFNAQCFCGYREDTVQLIDVELDPSDRPFVTITFENRPSPRMITAASDGSTSAHRVHPLSDWSWRHNLDEIMDDQSELLIAADFLEEHGLYSAHVLRRIAYQLAD